VLNATFFFPGGEFEIKNSINLYIDNAKTKVDSDFAKKIETDTLTKAISKLGFNADIFMGKFDDTRYVDEMTKEFEIKVIVDVERLTTKLNTCTTPEEVSALYKSFSPNERAEMKEIATKIGTELKETLKSA